MASSSASASTPTSKIGYPLQREPNGFINKEDISNCIKETLRNPYNSTSATWRCSSDNQRTTIVQFIYGIVNNCLASSKMEYYYSDPNIISESPLITKTVWHFGSSTITYVNSHMPVQVVTTNTKAEPEAEIPNQLAQLPIANPNPTNDDLENELDTSKLNQPRIFCITVDKIDHQFQSLWFEFISESGAIIRFKFPPPDSTTTTNNDDYYIKIDHNEIRIYLKSVGLVLTFNFSFKRIYDKISIDFLIKLLEYYKLNVRMVEYYMPPRPPGDLIDHNGNGEYNLSPRTMTQEELQQHKIDSTRTPEIPKIHRKDSYPLQRGSNGLLSKEDISNCIKETLGYPTSLWFAWADSTDKQRTTIVQFIYGIVNNWLPSSHMVELVTCPTNLVNMPPEISKIIYHMGLAKIKYVNCRIGHIPIEILTTNTKAGIPHQATTTNSNQIEDLEEDELSLSKINQLRIFCITVVKLDHEFQSLWFEFISESGALIRFRFPPTTVKDYCIIDDPNGDIRVYFKPVGLVLAFGYGKYGFETFDLLRLREILKDFYKLKVRKVNCSFVDNYTNLWEDELYNHLEPLTISVRRILEVLEDRRRRRNAGRKKRIHKKDISAPINMVHVQHAGRGRDDGHDGIGEQPSLAVNGNEEYQVTNQDYGGNGNGNIVAGEGEEEELQLKMTSSPQTPGSQLSEEEEFSPTTDKETMTFIYNVIEQCTREITLTRNIGTAKDKFRLLRNKKHQMSPGTSDLTVQIPIIAAEELHSPLDAADLTDTGTGTASSSSVGNQTQAQNIPTGITTAAGRDKLISDLQFLLENDEEAAELIFDFKESFKKESPEVLRLDPHSPATATEPVPFHVTSTEFAGATANSNELPKCMDPRVQISMESSNSFDTSTSTLCSFFTEEAEEEKAENEASPPPPSSIRSADLTPRTAQKHQLVSELRAKFRESRDVRELTTVSLSNENSAEEEEEKEDFNVEKYKNHNQQDKHKENQ